MIFGVAGLFVAFTIMTMALHGGSFRNLYGDLDIAVLVVTSTVSMT